MRKYTPNLALMVILLVSIHLLVMAASQAPGKRSIDPLVPFIITLEASAESLAEAMDIDNADLVRASLGTSDPRGASVGQEALSFFPTQGKTFVVLATGLAESAYDPDTNNSESLNDEQAQGDDESIELDGLDNIQHFDLVQLTLVLTPPPDKTSLNFDFAFYSEEFPDFINREFNDAFIAELGAEPFTSTIYIEEKAISAPNNIAFDPNDHVISVNAAYGFDPQNLNPDTGTTYDGTSGLLEATGCLPEKLPTGNVVLVLSITDLGDSKLDSAVLIDNFRWGNPLKCQEGVVQVTSPGWVTAARILILAVIAPLVMVGVLLVIFIGTVAVVRSLKKEKWNGKDRKEVEKPVPKPPTPLVRRPNFSNWSAQAILNQKFIAELRLEPPEPQAEADAWRDIVEPGQQPEVEVVLRAPGFDIEGGHTRVLQVERGAASKAQFKLISRRLGEQQHRVDFYQYGRRIGTARRNVLVGVEEQLMDIAVPQPEISLLIVGKKSPTVPPPDLELVVELDRHDNHTLHFTLHSTKEAVGYHHAKFGQKTLRVSPEKMMKRVSKAMSRMAGRTPPTPDAQIYDERRLTRRGNDLWDLLIPTELQQEYWKFRGHVKSILITSDEPWVPWEMVKPFRYNDEGGREDDPFWCQQFALSRWLSGPATTDELPVGAVRPVAATRPNLPAVPKEVAFIAQLNTLRPGIVVLAPLTRRMQMLNWLEKAEFSILHVACHGRFDSTLPGDSAIKLSDGLVRPSDIRVRFGGRRPRPLIFINACEGGRVGFNFTGLGGWANQLVQEAHVGAFVGALWEVDDALALQFAQRFYIALLRDNETIAEAFRQAREETHRAAPYDSTWLAYVLYADPEGLMTRTTKGRSEA